MGVFSKLKGIFYDEVEVEEDDTKEIEKVKKIVKKEPKEVNEIPKIEEVKFKPIEVEEEKEEEKPLKEREKQDNTFNERELFRSERTFNFVDFDNDDEEEKTPSRRNVLSEQNRNVKVDNPLTDTNEPKVFKPTPVISPIWGVLDKDYKKDEIQEKSNITTDNLNSAVTSYDTVRRKAYGTLEDDLEDTLNTVNKLTPQDIKKEEVKEEKPKKELDVDLIEQKTQKIENLISKIEEASNDLDKTMSISIGEIEDAQKAKELEEESTVSDKTLTDSTLEHDLFNLIDSMYDDKEE